MSETFLFFNLLYLLVVTPKISYATNIGEDISVAKIILKLVLYLILFIVLLIFISYVTKVFAKRSRNMLKSKYIKIIDTISFGTNEKIIIAKIFDYIYILSSTNNNISLIDKLNESECEIDEDSNFEEYLNKHMKNSSNDKMKKIRQKVKQFTLKFDKNINNKSKEDEENEKHD